MGDAGAAAVVKLWEQRLVMTDRGFAASTNNIALILENDDAWCGQLRYDARGDRVVLGEGAPIGEQRGARELRDSDHARIAMWLEASKYAIRVAPSNSALSGAISVVAEQHAFDDVRDYLQALEWDGVRRLDVWPVVYLGAADEPITRAFGAKWMISAVARTFEPGCQADHTLVLIGAQGTGKSSAIRTLAGASWYADSVTAAIGTKDAAEGLRGVWIVELSELDALSRAEQSTIKAFISRATDRYRAAYGRRTESHGRRVVFAGTTNEHTFLRDATGGRRFWPITVGRIDLPGLEQDRDQLWAEARVRYDRGERWHLEDAALVAESVEAQDDRYLADAWEPLIADLLARSTRVTVGDVLEKAIGLKPDRWDQASQNRVARVLQRLGWVRKRRRDGDEQALRWAYERGGGQP